MAFVNYTALGYGDVSPLQEWRGLGPLTAMNGILIFGWSTARLFEALQRTVERLGLRAGPRKSFNSAGPG